MDVTKATLEAHQRQQEIIDDAIEQLAINILKATNKIDNIVPYRGLELIAKHGNKGVPENNYWSYRGYTMNKDGITVEFEFISQSPDSYSFSIPYSYLS